jgi:hypothetical protein
MGKDFLDIALDEIEVEHPTPDPTPNPDPTPDPNPTPDPDPNPEPIPEPEGGKVDELKILGTRFGQTFENEEKFNEWKTGLTAKEQKLVDTETRLSQIEAEKAELENAFNPEGLFKSDKTKAAFKNLFVFDGLLDKMPDKDPVHLYDIITKDYKDAYTKTPIDILAKDLMLENPEIYADAEEAEEAIFTKYGISADSEAVKDESGKVIKSGKDEDGTILISDADKKRMQVDAKNTVTKWDGYKKSIAPPKEIDLPAQVKTKRDAEATRIQKMTQATEPLFTKKIPAGLKEIETAIVLNGKEGEEPVTIPFKYEIGEGYAKSKVVADNLAAIRQSYVQKGSEWTPEIEAQAAQEVTDLMKAIYLYKNLAKYSAAIYETALTNEQDAEFNKRHNVRPLRSDGTVRKPTGDQKANAQTEKQMAEDLGIKI